MTEAKRYSDLVRLPGAPTLILSASVGRLVFGGLPLALLVLVAQSRDSYGEAGAALALYGLFAGLLGPYRTRLAERNSTRFVVIAMAALYLVAVVLVTLSVTGPLVLLLAATSLAGALPPPVGPLTRAEWKRKVGGSEASVRQAYSLDASLEEIIYVLAPGIASVAIGIFDPSVVVIAGGGLLFLSGAGLAVTLSRNSSKVALAHPAEDTDDLRPTRPRSLWSNGPFLVGLTPVTGLSFMLGGLEVAAIAAAIDAAGSAFAGIPAAAVAVGSFAGGLVYGKRTYRGTLRQQVLILVSAGAAMLLLAAAIMQLLPLLVAVLALAGICIAPALVCSYMIAEEAAPDVGAEASAWVNSAFNLSLSAGAAVAGIVVQAFSPQLALVAVVAVGGLIALLPELHIRRWATANAYPVSGKNDDDPSPEEFAR